MERARSSGGLGLGIHTWGGRGHTSNCEVIVYPDGGVEARLGSQDLGTGTTTIIAMVLAETFGLDIDDVKVSIGDSRLSPVGSFGRKHHSRRSERLDQKSRSGCPGENTGCRSS